MGGGNVIYLVSLVNTLIPNPDSLLNPKMNLVIRPDIQLIQIHQCAITDCTGLLNFKLIKLKVDGI